MSFGSSFSVAGMSSSTSSHTPNLNTWGSASTSGQLGSSFSDSLSQSRSHYQPGYLMSTSQNSNTPQSSQRVDDVPIVQTKAKLNNVLTRGSASEFGMEAMFQSARQRQTFTDEDAPPRTSVHDIPNEIYADSSPHGLPAKNSALEASHLDRRHTRAPPPVSQPSQPVYVVVFGYPPEKYPSIVEYFKSFGSSTEPEPNTEVVNCFRIGYHDPADAMRAVRKNGEVFAGSWMIGTKWAEPAQAEALLGQPLLRTSISGPTESNFSGVAMAVDEPTQSPFPSGTQSVGTPIRLAPSTSAFRKAMPSKPATPLPAKPSGTSVSTTSTPNKGVLGQVSDLIFGW